MTAGVTLASDFDTVGKVTHVTVASTHAVLNGVETTKLTGKARSSSETFRVTLWISNGATPLPLKVHYNSSSSNITATWSKWGEKLNFLTPTSTQPFPF
jgi:hypothetical protein